MIKDIVNNNQEIKGNERVIDILHREFSSCFTHDGKFDIDVFKELVGVSVPTTNEGYSLQFLGKSYASLVAATDTTTVMVPDEAHNSKPENINSQNIYISGDNLDALKHLRNSYSEAIKCIYIDPPYNTGSDGFVYNDNFNYTTEQLQSRLGISEEASARILEMTTKGSASHSAWLTFMFPRLMLARDLLTKDGIIFISIDDNEQANLKLLCDSIFGEENFVSQISIITGANQAGDGVHIQKNVEYVLCYSKNIDLVTINRVDKTDNIWRNLNDAPTALITRKDMGYTLYYNPMTKDIIPENDYTTDEETIKTNDESIVYCDNQELISQGYIPVRPGKRNGQLHRWRWGMETFIERKGEIKMFEHGETFVPKFLQNGYNPPKNYQNFSGGAADLKVLFGENVPFDYPKSVALVKFLINIGTAKEDLILDFFSGSATTAHAVMQLNSEDNGKRRIISVQLPENLDLSFGKASSENKSKIKNAIDLTDEIGKPHFLDEIGQERIIRAAKKIKEDNSIFEGDLGYKHYSLKEPSDQTFAKLEEFNPNVFFTDNILDDFGIDTILCTWTLRDGYGFNAEIKPIDLAGYTAFLCDRHLYFINPGLINESDPSSLVALIEKYNNDKAFTPENIVLFGYSFTYTETEALKKNLMPLRDGIKNLKVNLDIRY